MSALFSDYRGPTPSTRCPDDFLNNSCSSTYSGTATTNRDYNYRVKVPNLDRVTNLTTYRTTHGPRPAP